MNKSHIYLLLAAMATIVSCGTTNSGGMNEQNTPVAAIAISIFGTVDPSNRTIGLPPGDDDLLLALKNAFSSDGWIIGASTANARYTLRLETKVWTSEQTLSYIKLSIVDQRTGAEILSGTRQTKSPYDTPIDVKAVAEMVISSLKSNTAPLPDNGESPSS
jgi:hypothetical protein